jgi:hypothetical protein
MRITNTGRVGIGLTNPTLKFQARDNSSNWTGLIENTNNNAQVFAAHGGGFGMQVSVPNIPAANFYMLVNNPNTSYNAFYIRGDGFTGIGTQTQGTNELLNVAGNLNLSGTRSTIFFNGDGAAGQQSGLQFGPLNNGQTTVITPTRINGTTRNGTLQLGGNGAYNSNVVNMHATGGVRSQKTYQYFVFRYEDAAGTSNESLGQWDMCYSAGMFFRERSVNSTDDMSYGCQVFPEFGAVSAAPLFEQVATSVTNHSASFSVPFDGKPTWRMRRVVRDNANWLNCYVSCFNME